MPWLALTLEVVLAPLLAQRGARIALSGMKVADSDQSWALLAGTRR